MTSKLQAEIKARRALELIEHAQTLVSQAAQELSPLVGLAPQHKKVCDLYDKIKKTWHEVNFRTAGGKFDMDSTWKRNHE